MSALNWLSSLGDFLQCLHDHSESCDLITHSQDFLARFFPGVQRQSSDNPQRVLKWGSEVAVSSPWNPRSSDICMTQSLFLQDSAGIQFPGECMKFLKHRKCIANNPILLPLYCVFSTLNLYKQQHGNFYNFLLLAYKIVALPLPLTFPGSSIRSSAQ